MCGITGFFDFSANHTKKDLKVMATQIAHRGPDDEGIELIRSDSCQIGLAHRRLSILDLSPLGHQPMRRDNMIIVYNGEIYNFREIRNELEQLGYSFTSDSDTEVILRSFQYWGEKAIDRYIGMFAFVIVDLLKQTAWVVRDRSGVKPLYYTERNSAFYFASEVKSLKSILSSTELDVESFQDFLRYGYTSGEHSIYKNVKKVKPGHFLKIDLKTNVINEVQYWSVYDFYTNDIPLIAEEDILIKVEELLESACKMRLVSDVPVGIFLSGGYDSSLVTALVQKNIGHAIKTFTIGFEDDNFNEAPYAKAISGFLGTDHSEYICSEKDALDIIPHIPFYFDEPFGDSSAIPTMLVSKMARQHVTVALSADAGDEVFGGYNKYSQILLNLSRIPSLPYTVRKALSGLNNRFPLGEMARWAGKSRFEQILPIFNEIFSSENLADAMLQNGSKRISNQGLRKLLVSDISRRNNAFDDGRINGKGIRDNLNRLMAIDYETYLPDDILVKVDRSSMSVSLEGREPLLDHRIIEFVAALPSHYKIRNGDKKYLLKRITQKHIPKSLLDRPKKGFAIPVNKWMRKELNPLVHDMLDNEKLKKQGLFNYREVALMLKRYEAGENHNSELIWFMLMFQLWNDRWKIC